ncbi:MAG: GNAT family N-acetyltransferase, partial [Bacteroidota bacterium]
MQYRRGKPTDFEHIETFVWQAIFPAYDHPDLNDEQRASNDAIVETAREECLAALTHPQKHLISAYDERRKELAGFVIIDRSPLDYPDLYWLIVGRRHWGKGVAAELLRLALEWIGEESTVKLGVIHYNNRAIRFYEKHGFKDTGEEYGSQLIPRKLMLRPAGPPPPRAELPKQLEMPLPETPRDAPVYNPLEPSEYEQASETLVSNSSFEETNFSLTDSPAPKQEEGSTAFDIEFEVNYGEKDVKNHKEEIPAFEFDFSAPSTSAKEQVEEFVEEEEEYLDLDGSLPPLIPEESVSSDREQKKQKICVACSTQLPLEARFCYNCGKLQPDIGITDRPLSHSPS